MEILLRKFDKHYKVLEKIEATGALDILHDQARQLREKGDSTAIVLRHKTFRTLGSRLLVALHWELVRSGTVKYPKWMSKGVGIEATEYLTPSVRFTDGASWSYLDLIHKDSRSDSLESQIQKAMHIARSQSDYRYGENLPSWRQNLTRGYKILSPNT